MTSVWIVEEGEYSDYGVTGIFATEAQAKEFSEARDASYREWPLDTWTPEQERTTVTFDISGNVVYVSHSAYTERAPAEDELIADGANNGNILITVRRGPRERAIKVASEKFTQVRAKLDEAKQRCANLPTELLSYWRFSVEAKCAAMLAGVEPIPTAGGPINDYLRGLLGGAA